MRDQQMPGMLANKVVVITGASSGVGRATALEFADRGARLVLAARRVEPLEALARECEHMGTLAIAVPVDVTDEAAVNALAQRAVEEFGHIDVWVNNAGVAALGRFEEVPMRDHVRVVETDLFGTMHGARAVLPIFKRQGAGILINTGSLDSKLSEPYMDSYVAAKHGIAGLGQSLRQELAVAGAKHIHVCTVMPETIDTPFFQHNANYSGRAAKALPPVLPAEQVAGTIVRLAERPRREVFVGKMGRMLWVQSLMLPGLTEWMFGMLADRLQLSTDRAAPPTDGNLFEAMSEGTSISDGWKTTRGVQQSDVRMGGMLAAGLGALALLGTAALAWNAAGRPRAAARG